jgi:hypothetical protein
MQQLTLETTSELLIRIYRAIHGLRDDDDDDPQQDLTLVLADMIYWADANGVDWDAAVKEATAIHDKEVQDVPIGELGFQLVAKEDV